MALKNDVGYIRCLRILGLPGDVMDLGPGVGLMAPGGIIGATNTPGNVYFVDYLNGNNANAGTYPAAPWQTVAYALTQCVNDHDDYIIVLDQWNEPTPVAVNVTRVHIIGLSSNPSRLYPTWTATGDTAILTLSALSNFCEIAGFDFGGGATHGAIENVAGTPMGVNIHHCTFGETWPGNTPAYGINIALNATAIRISDCKFRGTGGNAGGTITIDGIRWNTAADNHGGDIRNNIFQGCPNVGINISARGDALVIAENLIACDADTQGAAITLGATALGCFVVGNKAMYGDVAGGMVQNPFLDLAAAAANHWASNMKGAAFIDPA